MPYALPEPMLAKAVDRIPDPLTVPGGPSFEPKWDRFRHAVQFLRWRKDRDARSCGYDQLETISAYDVDAVLED